MNDFWRSIILSCSVLLYGTICHRLNHPLLFSFPAPGDAYYLAIGGGVAEHNWNHIRTVLQDQGFRCQLTDHSEDMGMISIQGPKRWGKKRRRKEGMMGGGRGGRGGIVMIYISRWEKDKRRARSGVERNKKKVTDWSKDRLWFTSWTREVGKLKRRAAGSIGGGQVKSLFLRLGHRHERWASAGMEEVWKTEAERFKGNSAV